MNFNLIKFRRIQIGPTSRFVKLFNISMINLKHKPEDLTGTNKNSHV